MEKRCGFSLGLGYFSSNTHIALRWFRRHVGSVAFMGCIAGSTDTKERLSKIPPSEYIFGYISIVFILTLCPSLVFLS